MVPFSAFFCRWLGPLGIDTKYSNSLKRGLDALLCRGAIAFKPCLVLPRDAYGWPWSSIAIWEPSNAHPRSKVQVSECDKVRRIWRQEFLQERHSSVAPAHEPGVLPIQMSHVFKPCQLFAKKACRFPFS